MSAAWSSDGPLGAAPARRDATTPAANASRMGPGIDVVVPAYCYGRFLRQCVHSVLSQDVEGLRVLIIDDASTDDTSAVAHALASEDARVQVRVHAHNRGHLATFNEGVDWCEAEYMLLLSADDYLLPGALRRAVAAFSAAPSALLCIGHAMISRTDGMLVPARELQVAAATREGESGRRFVEAIVAADANNIVVCATAVVRTRFLKATGGYRPDMPHAGDLELWLRLAAFGDVCVVGEAQAVYRRHDLNMSSAYSRDFGIADMRQRKAAIDAFGELAGSALPIRALHRRLRRALAREALGQASDSYSAGALDASRQLLAFANETAPSIRFSLGRLRLAAKHLLGVERSRALLRRLRGADPDAGATGKRP